ncbi:hypothetical protein [Rhodobacter sp. NSM]|uniref:hypothetical protein n=1 Tax=Rhodobacter sp. NSM TaxID=3457501 RepID=UPI003FD27FBB
MSCTPCRLARRGLLNGLPLFVLFWQLGLNETRGEPQLGLALLAMGGCLVILSLMLRAARSTHRRG